MTPSSSAWRTLALTSVAVFVVSLDGTALFVAFPAIRATFAQVSAAQLSWVLNAYTIAFGALLVPTSVIGVALVIALLGRAGPASEIGAFRSIAAILVAGGVVTSLVCLGVKTGPRAAPFTAVPAAQV